jgi:hypothetical protein
MDNKEKAEIVVGLDHVATISKSNVRVGATDPFLILPVIMMKVAAKNILGSGSVMIKQ